VCSERGGIVDAVRVWTQRMGSYVQTTRDSFVHNARFFCSTNRRAKDAMRMEEFDPLLSVAFAQTCALKEVQPVTLQRI
jgi:hypothetical protein